MDRNQKILEAAKKLYAFHLEWSLDKVRFPQFFNRKCGYVDQDEKAPFFSEACLYNLFGKDDARTILALIHNILWSAGLSEEDIMKAEGF
jgi:hypothetical protein